MRPIPIGVEFYKEMIEKNFYYIDKTQLIKDILDSNAKVSLFTRPRRFGKTLALTMLKAFFEDQRDEEGKHIDNRHYFEGKRIARCGETYMGKAGKYPVINLTMKSVKQPTYEIARHVLVNVIQEEFERHRYILQGEMLSEKEKEMFLALYRNTAEEGDYVTALAFLSKVLSKYHGKNVIILVDEYDVPLENAYFEGFYDKMIAFIRSLFESALKTNDSLEFAVITGCLRISKESIFTGLNNLAVNSVLNDEYAEHFGFTEPEAEKMLVDYGLEEKKEELRKWYDGYRFGRTEVYNPWSVINYVKAEAINPEAFPKPYWSNTSSNSIVRELVEAADVETREEIEKLIAGSTIEKPIHEDVTYGDIHESQDHLWNFLFFTGYLKKISQRQEEETLYLTMMIPNAEVRSVYRRTILSWFDRKIKGSDRTSLYKALLAGDCPTVEKNLKKQLVESISFHDEAEQFYHGFMMGMLGGLGEYRLKSNRESGDGRADLMMLPYDEEKPVIIFEFKKAERFSEMERLCQAALRQIEEKQYDAEQKEEGYLYFIKYGICFCKKSCKVKGLVESMA